MTTGQRKRRERKSLATEKVEREEDWHTAGEREVFLYVCVFVCVCVCVCVWRRGCGVTGGLGGSRLGRREGG